VAAEIDHRWVKTADYPKHGISQSGFDDLLGRGQQLKIISGGLTTVPDLVYVLRLYDALAFGEIEVELQNQSAKKVTVQRIRSVEAIGERLVNLEGSDGNDRVLSDSFSENRPALRIFDLGQSPQGLHRAVGSQLIYNQASKQSLLFGALTSQRFLTIMKLQARGSGTKARVASYTVDSTGTTEVQVPSLFPDAPVEQDRIELSLPLDPGSNMSSERVMFAAGTDYHTQLEAYGAAIRQLHKARVNGETLLGWWSWTAYYRAINEDRLLADARLLAERLKGFGYDYFHIDSGYEIAPGEYAIPDATRFPHGMPTLTREIRRLGLKVGIWTAPFYVGEHAWAYEHHKEWLVKNAQGVPIRIMKKTKAQEGQDIFVLDTTHPGAQEYLRKTYETLVKDWGARYIKLDFMDSTAIEGYYYRPYTTALEAQRIGLEIIRTAVGEVVWLDKDGSPMLNPVGLVDEGRISQDTAHTFVDTKESASGIAARYYMHRNFFMSDPDAFNISRQIVGRRIRAPLTLSEAQASIVLAAVSGGMFEIGDDLPILVSDAERMALATNPDLLRMAKLGRASKPVDLLTYRPEDEQPSIFLLREDDRQSMLAVFNWTDQSKSHAFTLSDLNLPSGHVLRVYDALAGDQPLPFEGDAIVLNGQPAHSVRLIKIVEE